MRTQPAQQRCGMDAKHRLTRCAAGPGSYQKLLVFRLYETSLDGGRAIVVDIHQCAGDALVRRTGHPPRFRDLILLLIERISSAFQFFHARVILLATG